MVNSCLKPVLAGCAGLVLLAACTTPDGARTGLRAVDEADGAIVFDGPAFAEGASERIIYATTQEREEYALYKAADRQAEIVYITTRHLHLTNLVVDRQFNLDAVTAGFRHIQGETPVPGEAFQMKLNGIAYWARPFQLPVAGETCAAFNGSWDSPPDDLRPSKVLFGYVCEVGNVPLTPDDIRQTVAKIGLRGITADAVADAVPVPPLSDQPTQADLLARATGQPGGETGNTEFPYKVVRYFKRDENCIYPDGC